MTRGGKRRGKTRTGRKEERHYLRSKGLGCSTMTRAGEREEEEEEEAAAAMSFIEEDIAYEDMATKW